MVEIEIIRKRIQAGNYLIKSHAVQHALKEGFTRHHMVEIVMKGKMIESYPDEQRALFCGRVSLSQRSSLYLHVVCEYTDPVYIEFITAYTPDEEQWESPPFKRRKIRRK